MGRNKKPAARKRCCYDSSKKTSKTNAVSTSLGGGGGKKDEYRDDGRVVIRDNSLFVEFYKAQKIVDENEWGQLMESLRTNLPSSFRLVGCRKEAMILKNLMQERFLSSKELNEMEIGGIPVTPPQELPWYPSGLGFQMTLPRQIVRKHPILSAFHNFLVTETEMGNVSRQETVSMIPPLLLDVQPHHKVFDMCAAPGSKTAQLIEMLHSGNGDGAVGGDPSGFVLANDFDNKRCYLLVHQSLKRLSSPCCLITNMDATNMPNVQMIDENTNQLRTVQFDRILCDVPCSGDGTMRKNVSIWKQWSLYHAYNLHKMQFRIAKRAIEMLAVGGVMVYSTCSLNPAENEATVFRLLEYAAGSLELVDVSEKLPGLKRRPGLRTWTIMDKKGNKFSSYQDLPNNELRKQIPEPVFPPSESQAEEAHLERCVRILPHDQDTGGFFVAVLRKTRELHNTAGDKGDIGDNNGDGDGIGVASSAAAVVEEPVSGEAGKKARLSPPAEKKPKYSGFREDPFTFITDSDNWWDGVKEYFDVKDGFPRHQLLCRCSDQSRKRNVYYVNEAVKRVIQNNGDRIKIINAGLRLFTRTEEKKEGIFHYRLAQESLHIIVPYLRKRVAELVIKEDLIKLLLAPNVLLDDFSESTRSQVENLSEGSLAVVYKQQHQHEQQEQDDHHQIIMLSCWRGKVSVASYVTQDNRVHILRMIGHDTRSLEDEMVRQRKKPKKEEEEESLATTVDKEEAGNEVQEDNVVTATADDVS